jgi:ATP-binding cassette subfamily B protein
MLKLIKQLRPFAGQIFLIFLLLLAQALTTLSLPNYMSRIVNVGIQQGGIENAVPEAIRASEMDKLTLFMDEGDRSVVVGAYTLLSKTELSQDEYDKYVKDYPALASEHIYKMNDSRKAETEQLNAVFGGPMVLVYNIEKNGISAFPSGNITLPAGVDPFFVLSKLPASQLAVVQDMAEQQLASMPGSVINQFAVSYLSGEYQALGVSVSRLQNSYILRIGGLMLLLALLGAVCSIIVGFISARVAAAFSRDTRRRVFNRVEHFSDSEFDKFSTASLITRSTNDIQQIQMVLVMLLRFVFFAPILGIGGIILALGEDVSMSWIIATAVIAVFSLIGAVLYISLAKFKLMQKLIDKVNLVTREILTGLMVIRAFNTQRYEEEKFDHANVDLTANQLFINRVMVFIMPAMMLIMNGVMLMVVWFGAKQVDIGSMQVGNMMAFMQYAMQIIMAFMMVSMVFILLPRAAVSAQRISEVLETEPVINDPDHPQPFAGDARGQVEFRGVSFKYAEAEDCVLKDISFVARPGQTTAFIGGTGSGKSTLINLIPRFYDVTEGEILVDNVDIRKVTQHDLREKIGYVSQQATLFSGTVENNIKYGREGATEDEVIRAAKTAQALGFIKESDGGFQMNVSQGGANLSGGQKQRIAIARALAKSPEILIFDDSFSALDFKTDTALRRALKKETGDLTVLIVAQRINTIMKADQIIVLDDGRIVGKGRHQALMESCEVYREMALSQMTKEELAS